MAKPSKRRRGVLGSRARSAGRCPPSQITPSQPDKSVRHIQRHCLGGRSTQLTMRRREFNCVPTVSPVGLGLGFLEKRCPPRPFNLAIRGNHFREFLGTRRPPPIPGFVNEEQKRSPISIQGGAGREDRDLWFDWLPQGWTLKMGRRALFRHARNSHRRPVHFPLQAAPTVVRFRAG